MRPYEVMLILESSAEDSTVQTVVDRIKETIGTAGGKLGQVDKWGRRRFAYELKHRWEGYYTLVEITGSPDNMKELDRVLTLSDEVVRHKIVRIPAEVAGSRPAKKPEPVGASTGADTNGAE